MPGSNMEGRFHFYAVRLSKCYIVITFPSLNNSNRAILISRSISIMRSERHWANKT